MLSEKKPQIEKYFEPVADSLSRVNPNFLTLIGSIPSLLFFVFVLRQMYLPAFIVFFGNIFDLIDGMVARKYNKITKFGGFLDSTMDRISDFLTITAFSFGGIIRWEITAPLLLLSFLTSYVRAHGELRSDNKISFAIGIIERPERLIFTALALAAYMIYPIGGVAGLNIAEVIFLVLIFLSAITVFQRILYAYKKL